MDLSGTFCIKIPCQEPQSITVKKVGSSYVFSFMDLIERKIHVQGQEIGYGVSVFCSRDLFRLTRFTVKGEWEEATYQDWRGRVHTVTIESRS